MSHSVTTDSGYDMIAREELILQRDIPVQKLLLTLTEASHVLAISRSKLYDLLNSGNLPSVYIGKSRRVRWSDVEAFVSGGGDAKAVSFTWSVK
jgi:excisionase family DNA binding protein